MAVKVKTRSGKTRTLLNPSETYKKYQLELKYGRALTNDAKRKMDKKTGKQVRLTDKQKAFRAGWISCANASSRAFKSKHPRYKRKTA